MGCVSAGFLSQFVRPRSGRHTNDSGPGTGLRREDWHVAMAWPPNVAAHRANERVAKQSCAQAKSAAENHRVGVRNIYEPPDGRAEQRSARLNDLQRVLVSLRGGGENFL